MVNLDSLFKDDKERWLNVDLNYRAGVNYLMKSIKERKFSQKGDKLAYLFGLTFPFISWLQLHRTAQGRARWAALKEYDNGKSA